MKSKKPSVKGMGNMGYLGHFAKDKYIQKGHNSDGFVNLKQLAGQNPNTNSTPVFSTPPPMGPDYQAPVPGASTVHNPNGGYSVVDYSDPDYVAKMKKLKGKNANGS